MRLYKPELRHRTPGRRDFLRGIAAATGATLLPGCCNVSSPDDQPLANTDWLRTARVAGLAAYKGLSACDVSSALDQLADQRVNVVEVDSDLSTYMTDDAFRDQLRVVDMVARQCHTRGMRCIGYYPILESLTPNAAQVASTMSKDHPDWIQIGMDGQPNVFVGGTGLVFWVDPGVESAWLCPTSGYVDYFVNRVTKLTATALDGLWGDVPLLSDIVGVWPCVNASCNAKFKADTGLDAPTSENWGDATFVKWIEWRHGVIYALEQRIVAAAKLARPNFEVVIETVSMDYTSATRQGLDGAARDDGLIHRIWEVDAVSDASSMRFADADDWMSMATMMKHACGCSAPRPAWCFCYGLQEDDAEHVMGLCIASRCNPYETQIPQMCTSVGASYRKRMYTWLDEHPGLLLAQPANLTALLYSSASRDIIDQAKGVGLYTSMNAGDTLWWTTEDTDSAKALDYMSDYRGTAKLLIHQHVPFDVLSTPHTSSDQLSRYRLIAIPSPYSLEAAVIGRLSDYVHAGGALLITGPDPGAVDENGVARGAPLLLQTLGITTQATGWTDVTVGAGRVLYTPDRAGAACFRNPSTDPALIAALLKVAPPQIQTDAPPAVVFDLRTADTGELLAVFVNLDGLGSQGTAVWTPRPAHFSCAVSAGSARIASVVLTRPDAGAQDSAVPFTSDGGIVRFQVDMQAVAAAIIKFG